MGQRLQACSRNASLPACLAPGSEVGTPSTRTGRVRQHATSNSFQLSPPGKTPSCSGLPPFASATHPVPRPPPTDLPSPPVNSVSSPVITAAKAPCLPAYHHQPTPPLSPNKLSSAPTTAATTARHSHHSHTDHDHDHDERRPLIFTTADTAHNISTSHSFRATACPP